MHDLPDESVLVEKMARAICEKQFRMVKEYPGAGLSEHLVSDLVDRQWARGISAAQAALSVLRPYMRGWKPISEAPKDGHRYLIAGEQQNVQWIAIGHYAPYDGCRWLSDDEKQLRFPTHFMELPPPPSNKEG